MSHDGGSGYWEIRQSMELNAGVRHVLMMDEDRNVGVQGSSRLLLYSHSEFEEMVRM